MLSINRTRTLLYRVARLLGDVQAVRRGPKAVARRVVRKAYGRAVARADRWMIR